MAIPFSRDSVLAGKHRQPTRRRASKWMLRSGNAIPDSIRTPPTNADIVQSCCMPSVLARSAWLDVIVLVVAVARVFETAASATVPDSQATGVTVGNVPAKRDSD
jgi:hypothetical protein